MRRLCAMIATALAVTVVAIDVFVVLLCVLSFGNEPEFFPPWARFAYPGAHGIAVFTVMAWQLAVPERWKR